MRIPEIKIEEIRNSANILDFVSGHVQLRKRGKNFIGLCPFHQEKTPSFTVSEEKQIYHCFGCGAGGNVFKFLMEFKNISFVEAVQEVAEQVGIKITYDKEVDSRYQQEQEILYDINVLAAKYFSNTLLNSEEGETARSYFKKRKIKTQIQKIFGLGYARSEWENLLFYLTENKVDLTKALQLGLIDKRDDGSFYDKFRGRIIFPIFSTNGRVIAFGGRILEDTQKTAKYLNSPESPIYSKRRSLYGLYHSKDEIRKSNKVILVEGYMDLISLFQHGVKNVVASSGTSLTEEQVQLLSRFSKNIIVLFDADSAGQRAALRSIEILLKQDFDVRVVTLPDNEDPDSYINKYGKDEFEDKISHAKNFMEYQSEQFEKAGMFEDPAKQTEAIRELVKTAALVNDELKRNLLIKTISKKFNLREKLIESELEKFLNQTQQRETRTYERRQQSESQKHPVNGNGNGVIKSFEKELIRLLFEGDKKIMDIIFDHIHTDEFTNDVYRNLAELVLESYKQEVYSPAAITERVEDERIKQFVFSLALNNEAISKKWDELTHSGKIELDMIKYTEDLVRQYRMKKIDEQIKTNNKKMSETSDEAQIVELMKYNSELQNEKKLIKNGNGNVNH